MIFCRAVRKSRAANRTDTSGDEFNLIAAGGTKYLTAERVQNFSAAQTLRRENNLVYII
jgi:hypothetical protein